MANLGAILKNLGNSRMPVPHLPALQPKPLISFGSRPAVPAPVNIPHPGFHPQEDLAPVQAELPATPTGSMLPTMPQPPVAQANPALEPRENPTGSVYRGQLEAQRRMRDDPRAKLTWGIPKGQPSPPMPSNAAAVQPSIEEMAEGTAWTHGIPRPVNEPGPKLPHQQLFNFLTAKPGQQAYDHAAPWQNLFQELSGPVLRNTVARRGAGVAGAAGAAAAGAAASGEAPAR